MGSRKIICESCGTEYKFEIAKNFEKCPVCGASLSDEEEHSDWITWYYYGVKNGTSRFLEENPINLGERYYLIKEFKAPPKGKDGNCDAAKAELRKYVPDAFTEAKKANPVICCPKCGCTEYTLLNRGYSVFTGFLGSGKVKRVCNRCKREF